MRIKTLLLGDIRFQYKYGFYFIYLFFSVFYIGLIYAFPEAWREKAAILMIFSDPAALGLFFMGAIVLFEKSERTLDSIAISPVKPIEYVISKLVSIGLISTVVSLAIGIPAGIVTRPIVFTAGVFLCSCLFSSVGLIIACRVKTLNQFVLATVPVEIAIGVPAVIWMFWYDESWLLVHPGVSMIAVCEGGSRALSALIFLLLWTALFALFAGAVVEKTLKSVGGVRL
ncbi:MAG: ABC transporter permease [Clostridia bacterium]|nr:ABC transporter permease [Clostridia bacterium]